jgi:non-specific serine/threonine protein kinase
MRDISATQLDHEQPLLAPMPLRAPTRLGFPIVPSGLVGRDADLVALLDQIGSSKTRLLTLIGPGGVGKTRLAIAAAARSERAFAGSAFVALASVQDPALVLSTIAHVLGVKEPADGQVYDVVTASLRHRRFLLVLDNFEHLLAAARVVLDLLTDCPELTILVTSRAPLRLSVEQRYLTQPLELPPAGSEVTPASLETFSAVALFVERARSQQPAFTPAERDLERIAEICRRLDGVPLAIELAAAWIRVLTPEMLLERLNRPLPMLRGGAEDHPARLRTMQDAIAWSFNLLTPDEAHLFCALGVFVGGGALEAVQHVAAIDGLGDDAAILDLLSELVDKSLLRAESDGLFTRFGMLETVREYALRVLAENGQAHAAQAAHADWCLAFAERAEPELAGPDSAAWVARIEAELGNIRAALTWLHAEGTTEQAMRLGGALGWFWSSGDRFAEGARVLDALLAMPGGSTWPHARVKVLSAAGDVAQWQGHFARAQEFYSTALEIYRGLTDQVGVVAMLRGLGSVSLDLGDLDGAEQLLAEVLEVAPQAGADWEAAAAANLLAIIHYAQGRFEEALSLGERAVEAFKALGDVGHVAYTEISVARFALATGDMARVLEVAQIAASQIPEDRADVLTCSCLEVAAEVAQRQHQWQQVARFLSSSEALRKRLGVSRWPAFQADSDRLAAACRQALGGERFARASAARPEDLDGVISEMLAMFAEANLVGAAHTTGPALSRRQREVLALLVDGASDREIAEALFISVRTASSHVSAVMARLDARTRAEAAIMAVREGLV